eukprot:1814463-Lingulodinium_polyedra.AAC.1
MGPAGESQRDAGRFELRREEAVRGPPGPELSDQAEGALAKPRPARGTVGRALFAEECGGR